MCGLWGTAAVGVLASVYVSAKGAIGWLMALIHPLCHKGTVRPTNFLPEEMCAEY
jgi:hypothetical protein